MFKLEAIMCERPGVSLQTILPPLETRVPRIVLQIVEEIYPAVMKSMILMGVVEVEPGSCSKNCVTPDDEIEVLFMRLQGDPGVEEKVTPVAVTFYTIKSEREEHQDTDNGDCPFHCDLCNKLFYRKHHLKQPQHIHSGECLYHCDVCNKSFICKSDLKKYLQIHSGEHLYHCGVCNKSFIHKCQLTTHQHIHSGEHLYHCDVCNKSFRFKSNLKTHQHIHSGKCLYNCDVCDKSFSHRGIFKLHASMTLRAMPVGT